VKLGYILLYSVSDGKVEYEWYGGREVRVHDVPALRHILTNGSLHILPFRSVTLPFRVNSEHGYRYWMQP